MSPDEVMGTPEEPVHNFSLELGKLEHGWLPVTVRADAQEVQFDASDMHPFSLLQLCEAPLALLAGAEAATVEWELEPVLCTFEMRRCDENVMLRVLFWDELRLLALVPGALFFPSILRALDCLWRLDQQGEFMGDELWTHPFPKQTFQQLRRAMQENGLCS